MTTIGKLASTPKTSRASPQHQGLMMYVLMTVPLFSNVSLMAHTPMNVPSSLLLHLPITEMPRMMLEFGERRRSRDIG
jgi:hypothetical protein